MARQTGLLRLTRPLPLAEHSRVTVTVQTLADDTERWQWLKASEETLGKTWDNQADDVFNELLQK